MADKFVKRNQVYFRSRGRTKLGWIHKSTPKRYLIWFREDGKEKSVWRDKDLVSFRKNGRRARKPRNPCPWPKNPCPWPPRKNVSRPVTKAAKEPWKMTRKQVEESVSVRPKTHERYHEILFEAQRSVVSEHKRLIGKALREGKPVPAAVLKGYPDLVKQAAPPRQNVSRGTVERAARLSERFHGMRPRRVSGVRITWPKALVLIGHVVRLDYLSDKEDGKPRIYTHDFDRPAQVFASGSARSGQKNILLLHGKFAITEEGIVG